MLFLLILVKFICLNDIGDRSKQIISHQKRGIINEVMHKGGLLLGGPLMDEKESANRVFSDMANKIPTFSNIHRSF